MATSLVLGLKIVKSSNQIHLSKPFVYIYTSKRINPGSFVVSTLLSSKDVAQINLPIFQNATISSDETLMRESLAFVLHDAKTIKNENGESYNYHRNAPIAEAFLFLDDLLRNDLILELNDPSDDDKEHSWRMDVKISLISFPSQRQISIQTGVPGISGMSSNHHNKHPDEMDKSCAVELFQCVKRNQPLFQSYKDLYIEKIRNHIKPSQIECQSIHVPYWKTIFGDIIAPMYAELMPRHKLDEQYFAHLIQIALGWNHTNISDVLSIIDSQFRNVNYFDERFNMVLKVICEAATIFANTCDYIPDLSVEKSCERFIDIQETLAGDCEDSAKQAQVILELLKRDGHNSQQPIIRAFAEVLEYYTVVLTTSAVTNASFVSDDSPQRDVQNKEKFMCHICTILIPKKYLTETLLSRSSSKFIANMQTAKYPFEDHLPILMCEGTSFVNPLLNPLSTYVSHPEEKKIVVESFKRRESIRLDLEGDHPMLKLLTPQSQQQNIECRTVKPNRFCSFYRKINEFWINFGGELGPVPFAVLSQKTGCYGVWIQDLVNKSPDLYLYEMYSLKSNDLALAREIVGRLLPMRTLRFQQNRPASQLAIEIKTQNRPVFDRLNELVSISNRNRSASIEINSKSPHYLVPPFFSYFVNRSEKISKDLLDEIKDAIVENPQTIGKFRYFVYPLTDDGELYLIELRFEYL